MASVAMAPNNSNDDRSGTDKSDLEDEDKIEVDNEASDSDATVNIDYRNAITKIKELQKKTKKLTAQYVRVVKQKDDMVRKHAQVLENRKTACEGVKTCHKTEVSEIKSTWKRNVQDLKETCRTDMRTRNIEKTGLMVQVSSLERDKTSDGFAAEKLQSILVKERASFNEVKVMYAAACCNLEGLTDINK
jgi:sugar-specific transcriptional regulator TrmB